MLRAQMVMAALRLGLCAALLLAMAVSPAESGRLLRRREMAAEEEAGPGPGPRPWPRHAFVSRKLLGLVPQAPLLLDYHGGPVLGGVKVYILWYGSFSKPQKHTVVNFLRSVSGPGRSRRGATVREWWSLVSGYKKKLQGEEDVTVPEPELELAGQIEDRGARMLGKKLKRSDLGLVVEKALSKGAIPAEENSVVLLLTAEDVVVEDFCISSCGAHSYVKAEKEKAAVRVPYAWVGNAGKQCPGMCAWPFARPSFPGAPDLEPLKPPNGDVGADGMVINIATVLAGATTNPLGNGFYQGDARLPLEAATACAGNFGPGAFPGWPGDLHKDARTGASYNAIGIKKRKFLLPAVWNPATQACALAP